MPSTTTPGHNMQLRSWLAELVMLRANKGPLKPYFWRDVRWKWRYTNEVKAVSKYIKTYGEAVVVAVAADSKVNTFTDYARLEFLLQNEAAKYTRLPSIKDSSPVVDIVKITGVDLREQRNIKRKKSLFEKLSELENGF